MDLSLVVIIVTTAAVCAGIVFTVRAFKASTTPATSPDRVANPTETTQGIGPHDRATTELLKRYFDGKACAICKRPIPPVRTGLKPGLVNPATHEAYSWDAIPHDNLPATLETLQPVCSACEVAESFRQRFPTLVVDREHGSPQPPSPDRIRAGS